MKTLQLAMCHTADILSRIKKLQVELEGGAQECGGIRKQLFINAKMKSGKSMSILDEVRKDLLRINNILQNYEKKRKAEDAQK